MIPSSLLFAQLLDLHLTRSIQRWKVDDTMSKFKALADAVRGDMENFDKQADELFAEREMIRREGETVFAQYREHHKEAREGIQAMRAAIADLTGSNSQGNGEGSDDLSGQTKGGVNGG